MIEGEGENVENFKDGNSQGAPPTNIYPYNRGFISQLRTAQQSLCQRKQY